MTPPEAPKDGTATTGNAPPAVSVCPPYAVETLCKRADFLRTARARYQPMSGFVLQARQRDSQSSPAPLIRIGFTASKKVGNAVARNRAKRRLRAITRDVLPTLGNPGWDYVLIARANKTAARLYSDLVSDLELALQKIHSAPR